MPQNKKIDGIAYSTEESIFEAYGNKRNRKLLLRWLQAELKFFALWLSGNVYCCEVYAPGNFTDQNGSYHISNGAVPLNECDELYGEKDVRHFVDNVLQRNAR